MLNNAEIVKVRINFEKGSQMLSQCDPKAADSALFEVANAVASLRGDDDVSFTKITEGVLLQE